jgi:hypothetical protein
MRISGSFAKGKKFTPTAVPSWRREGDDVEHFGDRRGVFAKIE